MIPYPSGYRSSMFPVCLIAKLVSVRFCVGTHIYPNVISKDPTCVLLPPCVQGSIPPGLNEKIIACLSTWFDLPMKEIQPHLWMATLSQYGKVRHLDGGDVMNASALVPCSDDRRDATFVRVSCRFKHNSCYRWWFPSLPVWNACRQECMVPKATSYTRTLYLLWSAAAYFCCQTRAISCTSTYRAGNTYLGCHPHLCRSTDKGWEQYLLLFMRGPTGDSGHGMCPMPCWAGEGWQQMGYYRPQQRLWTSCICEWWLGALPSSFYMYLSW